MRCCDARDLLPLLLDGQLAADELAAATSRALACGPCRAELTAMAENDQALRRALAAHAVPAGYFEGFWSRLETKLDATKSEGDSMRTSASQDRTVVARVSPPVDPGQDVAGKPIAKDEVSGLHEIKELAATTIRRHSGSMRAQTGDIAGEQLAIAPPSLSNVAMPQPGLEAREPVSVRSTSVSDADGVRVSAQLAAPGAPVELAGSPSAPVVVKKSRAGLYVGLAGLAVAAAAVGLYVPPSPAPQAVAVAPEAAPAPEPTPAVAPVEAAPTVAPVAPPPAAEPPAPVAAVVADEEEVKEEKPRARDEKPAAKAEGKKTAAPAVKASEPAKPVEAAPAPAPAKERNEIDDLFGDKPVEDQAKKVAAGPALPEKLTPADVKKGMGSVKARVQACYDQNKITGTIKLKVKIDASGEVSKVEVVDDKFKGSATGECVITAVKTAKFPEVSGAGLAVSYAFILQ